eukprot:TRINITY_DN2603_c0_g1_i2.p1 TRINITY_DN2603_c0_g1~~TRINITY_DN2603_c0_g1_i2.p1  ORF type:complete len:1108 (+),score=211.95 TRINITY_DN2603_c0_g1_i2:31-3354(+)
MNHSMREFMDVLDVNKGTRKKPINSKPCDNCRKQRKGCDGKNPCQRCVQRGVVCIQSSAVKSFTCSNCRKKHRKCDGDGIHPCPSCVKGQIMCVYNNKPVKPQQQQSAVSTGISRIKQLNYELSTYVTIHNSCGLPIHGVNPIDLRNFDVDLFLSKKPTVHNFFSYSVLSLAVRSHQGHDYALQFAKTAESMTAHMLDYQNADESTRMTIGSAFMLLSLFFFSSVDTPSGLSLIKTAVSMLPRSFLNNSYLGILIGFLHISFRNPSSLTAFHAQNFPEIDWIEMISNYSKKAQFAEEGNPVATHLLLAHLGYSLHLITQMKERRESTSEKAEILNSLLVNLDIAMGSVFSKQSKNKVIKNQLLIWYHSAKSSIYQAKTDMENALIHSEKVIEAMEDLQPNLLHLSTLNSLQLTIFTLAVGRARTLFDKVINFLRKAEPFHPIASTFLPRSQQLWNMLQTNFDATRSPSVTSSPSSSSPSSSPTEYTCNPSTKAPISIPALPPPPENQIIPKQLSPPRQTIQHYQPEKPDNYIRAYQVSESTTQQHSKNENTSVPSSSTSTSSNAPSRPPPYFVRDDFSYVSRKPRVYEVPKDPALDSKFRTTSISITQLTNDGEDIDYEMRNDFHYESQPNSLQRQNFQRRDLALRSEDPEHRIGPVTKSFEQIHISAQPREDSDYDNDNDSLILPVQRVVPQNYQERPIYQQYQQRQIQETTNQPHKPVHPHNQRIPNQPLIPPSYNQPQIPNQPHTHSQHPINQMHTQTNNQHLNHHTTNQPHISNQPHSSNQSHPISQTTSNLPHNPYNQPHASNQAHTSNQAHLHSQPHNHHQAPNQPHMHPQPPNPQTSTQHHNQQHTQPQTSSQHSNHLHSHTQPQTSTQHPNQQHTQPQTSSQHSNHLHTQPQTSTQHLNHPHPQPQTSTQHPNQQHPQPQHPNHPHTQPQKIHQQPPHPQSQIHNEHSLNQFPQPQNIPKQTYLPCQRLCTNKQTHISSHDQPPSPPKTESHIRQIPNLSHNQTHPQPLYNQQMQPQYQEPSFQYPPRSNYQNQSYYYPQDEDYTEEYPAYTNNLDDYSSPSFDSQTENFSDTPPHQSYYQPHPPAYYYVPNEPEPDFL